MSVPAGGLFKRSDDIGASIALPNSHRWAEFAEDINDRQNSYFMTAKKLIGHKVHGPAVIRCQRHHSIFSWLRHDLPLRSFSPQLQAFQAIKPEYPLKVDPPALSSQKNVNAPISVSDTYLGNLPNALA